jgi:hypothetical protein
MVPVVSEEIWTSGSHRARRGAAKRRVKSGARTSG